MIFSGPQDQVYLVLAFYKNYRGRSDFKYIERHCSFNSSVKTQLKSLLFLQASMKTCFCTCETPDWIDPPWDPLYRPRMDASTSLHLGLLSEQKMNGRNQISLLFYSFIQFWKYFNDGASSVLAPKFPALTLGSCGLWFYDAHTAHWSRPCLCGKQ